jgi:multiple sugar transport system substrate-binding protein
VIGKFDIAPLPTFTGEGTAASTGGYNFGVSKFSDNKEAAREYLLFASTDEEAQLNLGRNAVVPVLESVYDRLQDDRVMSVLSEVLPEAKARPPSPQWNAISEQIQRSVFPAYNGQKDVDTALSEIGGFLQTTIE